MPEFEQAERRELVLDAAIEPLARTRNAFFRMFQTPRNA